MRYELLLDALKSETARRVAHDNFLNILAVHRKANESLRQVGFFDSYEQTLLRYELLLDALKPETARKVAHDNFLNVLAVRKNAN